MKLRLSFLLLIGLSLVVVAVSAARKYPVVSALFQASGTQVYPSTNVAGQAVGPNTNVTYLSSNCGTQTNCFAVKWDVGTVGDATTTSASNIVTCPNSDCKFQTSTTNPAKVGQIFFATDSTSGGGGAGTCLDNPSIQFGGANQTTITSVDSDTQIHVSGNSGTTSTAKACIAWGDDDTTAINNAWTAGGCTATVQMPLGKAFFSAPIFQIIAGCPAVGNAGNGYQGQRVFGQSVVGTYLIPTPNFNFTAIAGNGAPSCNNTCQGEVGNPNIADYEQFNVWGLGERCAATEANTILWVIGTSTRAVNTNGIGWCGRGGGTTLTGYNIAGGTDIFTWGGGNYFGTVEANFNSILIYFGNSAFSGNASQLVGVCGIQVQPGSSVTSIGNSLNLCVQVGSASGSSATWNSQNSQIAGNTSGGQVDGSCIYIGNNSTVNLISNDIICINPGTNESSTTWFGTAGGVMRATNSNHFSNGTSACIVGTAGNIFEDLNDNTFTCGNGIWNGTGNWMGSGSAHSVAVTAAKLVLSAGWGSTAAWTALSGGDFPMQGTITNSGTGQAASPTITYTFPYALAQSPYTCTATQVGGNNSTGTFTTSSLSKTGATFTFSLTPTAADTEIVNVNCVMP